MTIIRNIGVIYYITMAEFQSGVQFLLCTVTVVPHWDILMEWSFNNHHYSHLLRKVKMSAVK